MVQVFDTKISLAKIHTYMEASVAKKSQAKRSFKLDIMSVLEAIDRKERGFYANLTEEERKGFAPRVVVRWLSAVSDNNSLRDYYILAANDLVNVGLWNLGRHPELQYLLMTVAGSGRKQYHQWIPAKATRSSTTPKFDALLATTCPEANRAEFDLLRSQFSTEEALDFAAASGIDDRELKEIQAELKKAAKGD